MLSISALRKTAVALSFAAAAALSTNALAFNFTDSFSPGSGLWSNSSGNWTSASGTYFAQNPGNQPPTYSGLPYDFSNFTLDVTVNNLGDGGIYLHTDGTSNNGILLVTGGGGYGQGQRGGPSGNSIYFHLASNGSYSAPINQVGNVFIPGILTTSTSSRTGTSIRCMSMARPLLLIPSSTAPISMVKSLSMMTSPTPQPVASAPPKLSATSPSPAPSLLSLATATATARSTSTISILSSITSAKPSSLRSDGNFDAASTIDLNDLNDVLNNLGTSLSNSAEAVAARAIAAAPEPYSLTLLLLPLTVLLRTDTRRWRNLRDR